MEHPENDSQYTGLTVNSGVVQPPIVNPYLTKKAPQAPAAGVGTLQKAFSKAT